MNDELQKNGWAIASHKLNKEILADLVEQKNKFLNISREEVEKEFNISLFKFESENIEYIELYKAITRALIRYEPKSFLLAQAVWKELKNTFKLSEIKYLGLPYPIIHLPEDTSEPGRRHRDNVEYIKSFYTTWTPLNNFFHQPLTITEKTHRKNNFFLRQLRIRFKFIDKFILSRKRELRPDFHLGEFGVWHGTTYHEGLLNKSGDITIANVTSFTDSPIMSGLVMTTDYIEKYTPLKITVDTDGLVKKIISSFKIVEGEMREATHKNKNLNKLVGNVRSNIKGWGFSPTELRYFAFVCVLWAQRLEAKKDVNIFYFYAFFSCQENFLALHKCIAYSISHYKNEEVSSFANSVLNDFGSLQAVFEIKEAIRLSGEIGKNIKVNYPEKAELLMA